MRKNIVVFYLPLLIFLSCHEGEVPEPIKQPSLADIIPGSYAQRLDTHLNSVYFEIVLSTCSHLGQNIPPSSPDYCVNARPLSIFRLYIERSKIVPGAIIEFCNGVPPIKENSPPLDGSTFAEYDYNDHDRHYDGHWYYTSGRVLITDLRDEKLYAAYHLGEYTTASTLAELNGVPYYSTTITAD